MEVTIGYAAFFAPEEWLAILNDDWSLLDETEPEF